MASQLLPLRRSCSSVLRIILLGGASQGAGATVLVCCGQLVNLMKQHQASCVRRHTTTCGANVHLAPVHGVHARPLTGHLTFQHH